MCARFHFALNLPHERGEAVAVVVFCDVLPQLRLLQGVHNVVTVIDGACIHVLLDRDRAPVDRHPLDAVLDELRDQGIFEIVELLLYRLQLGVQVLFPVLKGHKFPKLLNIHQRSPFLPIG